MHLYERIEVAPAGIAKDRVYAARMEFFDDALFLHDSGLLVAFS